MTTPPPAEGHAAAAAQKAMAAQAARAGHYPQALAHMQRACELAPEAMGLRVELGCLLAHQGQLDASLAHFRLATEREPSLLDAWHFLGVTLLRLGRSLAAIAALRHAFAIAPDRPGTREALAEAEFRAGFPADALPLWRELSRRRPDDEDSTLKLGETLTRLGQGAEAVAVFRAALARRSSSPGLWMALGQAAEATGERDAAAQAYERALALRPGWIFPLSALLGLLRARAPDVRVDDATARLAGALPDGERAMLGYELGKVLDGRGEHAAAMQRWDDANAARRRERGDFDDAAMQLRIERTIATFDAQLFATRAGEIPGRSDDPRPVFVVGMPRSGTTLTEQILAAHPQVFGAGELLELALIARSLPTRDGSPPGWPPRLDQLAPDVIAWAARRWLEGASRGAPADAARLVDKEPMNFHLLGLAALMFPRARVIWCRRDPRDIAVSIYGENFSLDEPFATSMHGIGRYIAGQERLMRHWQATLPLPILELHYEDLVRDIEPQARRLVDFLGLPWDPACLQFHQSAGFVQTPSRWQVRQPVHTRSVGRWRNYGQALAPLVAALDTPPADRGNATEDAGHPG